MINIQKLLKAEEKRQSHSISLIASENITSQNVRNALSSVLTNKYAEGYPGKRYYAGCEIADEIETECINLAKQLFDAKWANVQAHSGSQANAAVFFALLQPGDTILSLALESGGHLTHGAKISSTSRFYKVVNYGLNSKELIDLNMVKDLAIEHKPKLIITGASAYPQLWPWNEFREIADLNNSYLLADVAHTAGLIAGNVHENPINIVDVITATTHKTLRGPRGGLILSKNSELGAKIDRAIFPGIQGGPIMNTIAAKAIGFQENLTSEFKIYANNVVKNAKILAKTLIDEDVKLLTNGTENHLMIVDVRNFGLTGKSAEKLLFDSNITVSVSALPGEGWQTPNAIRLGTPYITTLGIENMNEFASLLVSTLRNKNITHLKQYVIENATKLYKKFYAFTEEYFEV